MYELLRTAIISVTIISGALYYWTDEETSTHTEVFCAYGKLFVTFKQDQAVWGTMLLDSRGIPIQCEDPNFKKESTLTYKKEII
jgi:hypothetical protein